MSILPDKVEGIAAMMAPKNIKETRSFLGLMQFYAHYIPHFAQIVAPLFKLLRKDIGFKWTETEEEAFKTCKTALLAAPLLIYPDPSKPFRLYTDASDHGISAILHQLYKCKIRDLKHTRIKTRCQEAFDKNLPVPTFYWKAPIGAEEELPAAQEWAENFEDTELTLEGMVAAASRTLQAAEVNYSITEKEALAVHWGLGKFQPIIEAAPYCLVITDHGALTYTSMYQNEINTRLIRWGLRLNNGWPPI
jgi:hypothetical protein